MRQLRSNHSWEPPGVQRLHGRRVVEKRRPVFELLVVDLFKEGR